MTSIVKFLEKSPGNRSMGRLAAMVMVGLTVATVGVCCFIGIHAVMHADTNSANSAFIVQSSNQTIQTIGMFVLGPCIAGIWIALGLKDKGDPQNTTTTTQVTTTGPAQIAPAVTVVPAATPSPGADA